MKIYIAFLCFFSHCICFATPFQQPPLINQSDIFYPCFGLISVSHIEGEGIGYSTGYTNLEALIFPYFSQNKSFPFFDIRGHVFDNSDLAANAGAGFRICPLEKEVIFGLNAYYDYRLVKDANYNQIGVGSEILGKRVDFRINGYIPLNGLRSLSSNLYNNYLGGYYITENKFWIPMIGGNSEIGYFLVKSKILDLYSAVGVYYFGYTHLSNRQAIGGQFRLSINFSEFLSLEGLISADSVFKTRVQGLITISFPFGYKTERRGKDKRLAQPIKRYEIIVLDKQNYWNWNWNY